MSDALELVLRYFVTAGCGWLAVHGLKNFDSDSMVSAATMIVSGVILWLVMVLRGLAKSTIPAVIARLQARHKAALLDGAAAVPGVSKIIATPQLADATTSSKVMTPSQAGSA